LNQGGSIFGGLGGFSCQGPHFFCHDSETFTCLARPGGFNGCVQSQNIGLECNVLNGLDDFSERPDFGLF